MSCITNGVSVITEAEFNLVLFFKVLEIGTVTTYIKEQYKLVYDSVTMKVIVTTTAGNTVISYDFVGIVSSYADLQVHLRANGIIV